MPTHQKATPIELTYSKELKRYIDVKLKTNKVIIGFSILGSFLPPLGFFRKANCFGKWKYLLRLVLIKHQKLPLFPIIKFLPHKRAVLAIKYYYTKTFENS
jgi:hypothetical protein